MRHTTNRRAAFNLALKLSLGCEIGFIASAGNVHTAYAQNANLEHMAFAAGTGQSDRQTISIRGGETLEQALIRAGAMRDDVADDWDKVDDALDQSFPASDPSAY